MPFWGALSLGVRQFIAAFEGRELIPGQPGGSAKNRFRPHQSGDKSPHSQILIAKFQSGSPAVGSGAVRMGA